MLTTIENLARVFAEDNCSDAIYPAHLFKAVLHKNAGLVDFIEKTLDKATFIQKPTYEDYLATDKEARRLAEDMTR